jgi:hypothetical protein
MNQDQPMLDDAQLLNAYQQMADLSARMLAATGERDWDALAEQERQQDALFAMLQRADAGQRRPADVLRRQQALIEEILANQSKRSELALEWRESIAALLGSVDSARRIAKAYG